MTRCICFTSSASADWHSQPSEIMCDWSVFFFAYREEPRSDPRHYHFHWPRLWVFFWPYDWVFVSVFMLFSGAGPLLLIIIVSGRRSAAGQRFAFRVSCSPNSLARELNAIIRNSARRNIIFVSLRFVISLVLVLVFGFSISFLFLTPRLLLFVICMRFLKFSLTFAIYVCPCCLPACLVSLTKLWLSVSISKWRKAAEKQTWPATISTMANIVATCKIIKNQRTFCQGGPLIVPPLDAPLANGKIDARIELASAKKRHLKMPQSRR